MLRPRLVFWFLVAWIFPPNGAAACSKLTQIDINDDTQFKQRMAASSVKVHAGWGQGSKSASGSLVSSNGYILTVGHLFSSVPTSIDKRVRVVHKPLQGAPQVLSGELLYSVYEPGVKGGLDFALVKISRESIGRILSPAPLSFNVSPNQTIRIHGYRLESDEPVISSPGLMQSIYPGVFTVSQIERRQGLSGSLGISIDASGIGILGGQFVRPTIGGEDADWTWAEEDDVHNNTLAFQNLQSIVGNLVENIPEILGRDVGSIRKSMAEIHSQPSNYQTQTLYTLFADNPLETLVMLSSALSGKRQPNQGLLAQLAVILFCTIPEDDRIPTMGRLFAYYGNGSKVVEVALKRVIDFGRERLAEFGVGHSNADLQLGSAALGTVFSHHKIVGSSLPASLVRDVGLEHVDALRQLQAISENSEFANAQDGTLKYLISNYEESPRVWWEAALNFGKNEKYDLAAEASAQALLLSKPFGRGVLAEQYLYFSQLAGESSIKSAKTADYEVRKAVPVETVLDVPEVKFVPHEGREGVVAVQLLGKFGSVDLKRVRAEGSLDAAAVKRITGTNGEKVVVRSVDIDAVGKAEPDRIIRNALGIR